MLPIFRQIKIFSKSVLLTALAFYFLDYLFDGFFYNIFVLNPVKLIGEFEYWRLFTFPFAYSTNEAFFLFIATFFFISENLEDILRQTLYPALLMLLTVLQGISMSLLFWQKDINISGMEGLSFFIIVFFLVLNPKSKIQIFEFRPIPSVLFALSIIFIWSLVKIFHIYQVGFENIDVTITSAGFGIITGMMTSAQIKYIQKVQKQKIRDKAEGLQIPKPEEYSYAMMSGNKYQQYNSPSHDNYTDPFSGSLISEDPEINEETLNSILDKINEKGKEQLSPSEIKFLDEYSKML